MTDTRHRLGFATLVGWLLLAGAAESADDNSAAADTSATRASTVPLPVLAYSPDTNLMVGGTVLRFFYLEEDGPDVRPSVLAPVFIRTTKSQTLAFVSLELNWSEGRNRFQIGGSYIRFPDQFYGIGRDASADDEENYTPESVGFEVHYERRVLAGLRVGGGWRQLNHRLDDFVAGGLLDTGGYVGVERTRVTGPTYGVNWDTRDNTWAAERGLWLQARTQLAPTALGSDLDYAEHLIDLRGYLPAGSKGVLAAQLTTTWLNGTPPFFALPKLGGEGGLRGYPGGRYLDRTRAIARLEYRRRHIWGKLGVVAFAGLGDVAPNLGKLTLAEHLWTAGGGLRYPLNSKERVNLRLDIGAGRGNSGFFLSLGEAF